MEYINALEMPDVFAFLHSLWKYPAAHQFLRAYFEYATPDERNDVVSKALTKANDKAIPFDRLPVPIQQAIMRDKGASSFEEFQAICERERAANQQN